jgi:hypothetical protein
MGGVKEPRLVMPLVPVSYNETRYARWQVAYRKGKPFRDALALMLPGAGLARPVPGVVVNAVLRFPVARRRDEGNFRTPLEKALGDALVKGGYLLDDTPDQFRVERVEFAPVAGPAETALTFTVLPGAR